ncbi:unnamed protein product [Pylaiella littoralis]
MDYDHPQSDQIWYRWGTICGGQNTFYDMLRLRGVRVAPPAGLNLSIGRVSRSRRGSFFLSNQMKLFVAVALLVVGCCRGFVVLPSSSSASAALRVAPPSCWTSSCSRVAPGRRRVTKLNGTGNGIHNVCMFGEVAPQVANKLVQEEGWAYVDVRADYEFEHGRPAGAVNIPAFFSTAQGMTVNRDFVDQLMGCQSLFQRSDQVAEKFPDKNAKLIMGCQMGSRSAQATSWLEDAGYSVVVNMEGGFSAWARDDSLPVEA